MIAIIDYSTGNLRSVQNALSRLGAESIVTSNHEEILSADRVLIPGVGHAATAMANLQERGLDKLIPTLTIPVLGICIGMQLMCRHSEEGDIQCLSLFDADVKKFTMQDLKVPHMGWNRVWRAANSVQVAEQIACMKQVEQMGSLAQIEQTKQMSSLAQIENVNIEEQIDSLSQIEKMRSLERNKTVNKFFSNIQDGAYFYYVHSFAPSVCKHTIATTNYGIDFSGALVNGNFFGTQFHPEKSGDVGEMLLKNFLEL